MEVTIVALGSDGAVEGTYAGTECLSFSGPGSALGGTTPVYPAQGDCPPGASAVAFAEGVATITVTLDEVGTTNLAVSDASAGLSGSSGAITVLEPTGPATTTTSAVSG